MLYHIMSNTNSKLKNLVQKKSYVASLVFDSVSSRHVICFLDKAGIFCTETNLENKHMLVHFVLLDIEESRTQKNTNFSIDITKLDFTNVTTFSSVFFASACCEQSEFYACVDEYFQRSLIRFDKRCATNGC